MSDPSMVEPSTRRDGCHTDDREKSATQSVTKETMKEILFEVLGALDCPHSEPPRNASAKSASSVEAPKKASGLRQLPSHLVKGFHRCQLS